jgi:hypothetical protein
MKILTLQTKHDKPPTNSVWICKEKKIPTLGIGGSGRRNKGEREANSVKEEKAHLTPKIQKKKFDKLEKQKIVALEIKTHGGIHSLSPMNKKKIGEEQPWHGPSLSAPCAEGSAKALPASPTI